MSDIYKILHRVAENEFLGQKLLPFGAEFGGERVDVLVRGYLAVAVRGARYDCGNGGLLARENHSALAQGGFRPRRRRRGGR